MTANLIVDRSVAFGALWYLFEGATVFVLPADMTGVDPLPSYTLEAFEEWVPYLLSDFYQFPTAGTVGYDTGDTDLAKLQQLQIVMDYETSITYTHVLIAVTPVLLPTTGTPPDQSSPFVGFIEEPTAVTLTSSQSKTYNIDLTALFSLAT